MIKKIFPLLTALQRRNLYRFQILIILMAIMELCSIASIGPFMALVADPSLVKTNSTLLKIYNITGVQSEQHFLFFSGCIVLFALALSSSVSIFTTWRLSLFGMEVGNQFANSIFSFYLKQDWLFHANVSTAYLTKKIAAECSRVTFDIILPLMQLCARAVTAIMISLAIIFYNPSIALVGLFIFVSGYIFIYFVVRGKMLKNGIVISENHTNRFALMNEGFGGVKDLILLGRTKNLIDQFDRSGNYLSRAQGLNNALGQTPRYFMEFLAFGAMIGLVLALLIIHNGSLTEVLPVLAVYALAGFKLLPALQQIYACLSQIRGASASLDAIKDDLVAAQKQYQKPVNSFDIFDEDKEINFENINNLHLKNISFSYPGSKKMALREINLTIPINSTVGFVGESGSGKSTLIDVILGLIKPDQGGVMFDDVIISKENIRSWQDNIGYVSQNIFLSEGTIAENVAFGIEKSLIDFSKVNKAIKLANLDEFIESLSNGVDTKVGERGVKLSGGQRQRIGIARALYGNAKVLVFDEATSALDGITEKHVMDALNELSGKRTIIIIAHRLKTVKNCSHIFLLDKGELVGKGNYNELIEKNEKFKIMSKFS